MRDELGKRERERKREERGEEGGRGRERKVGQQKCQWWPREGHRGLQALQSSMRENESKDK